MPVETANGKRTTISVKLDDKDLAKLDELAEAEYGVPMNSYGYHWGGKRSRSEVLRQAIRDAKVSEKGRGGE